MVRRRARLRFLVLCLMLALALLVWREQQAEKGRTPAPVAPATRLNVANATASNGPLTIRLNPPRQLNQLTRKEFAELRGSLVNLHPELLLTPYSPYSPVLGAIEDGAPWWSDQGMFVAKFWKHPGGAAAIAGATSHHARVLLNPFLLIAADCAQLVDVTRRPDLARLDFQSPQFPFDCEPQTLTWSPREGSAEAVYGVRDYLSRMHALGFGEPSLGKSHDFVALATFNAEDFGFAYAHLDESSENIDWTGEKKDEVFKLYQFFHRGGSCQYPGGCNNMSPAMPQYRLADYPAVLRFDLWYQPPGSSQKPDFVFVIRLK